MTDKEAQNSAKKIKASYKEIPTDIEFATPDDVEDMQDEYELVPLIGKSGNVRNHLVRHLSAQESMLVFQTFFPKMARNMQSQVQGLKVGEDGKLPEESLSEEYTDGMHKKDICTVKKGLVLPEGLTIEQITQYSSQNIRKLCDAIERDITANDAVAEFPEEGVGSEDPEESE